MLIEQQEVEGNTGLNASSSIAYIRPEFPGELFGSWLSRMVSLNAQPSLKSLGLALRLTANLNTPVADPINGPAYLFQFAPHLRRTPEELLNGLTTLSYWSAFASSDEASSINPRLSPPLLRFCPACIRDDLKEMVPYFHRDHQLRSQACAKHGILLLERCPDCERPICPAAGKTLLPLRCICGSSLSEARHDKKMSPAWHRLATLSSQALSASRSELELEHLQKLAVQVAVGKTKTSMSNAVRETLESAFGADGLEWILRRPGVRHMAAALERRFSVRTLPPQVCLAILAAKKVTFAEAANAVVSKRKLAAEPGYGNKPERAKWNTYPDVTFEQAKTIALEIREKTSRLAVLRYHRTKAFWMLVIKAPDWLLGLSWELAWHHVQDELPKLPSIEHDRRLIKEGAPSPLARQEAKSRALCRDREWMDGHFQHRARPVDHLPAVLDALAKARSRHMSMDGRPSKWTLSIAAAAIGSSQKTLANQAQLYREIRVLVPESPEAFATRKISWCIQQCRDRSIDITLLNIWRVVLGLRTGTATALELEAFTRLVEQR